MPSLAAVPRLQACATQAVMSKDQTSMARQADQVEMGATSTTYSLMSLQQDDPDELPSWDFAADVLGDFDQFLDTRADLPGYDDGVATAPGQAVATAEPADPSSTELDAELDPTPAAAAAPVPADRPSSSGPPVSRDEYAVPDKKQLQNRRAQQRFRHKQRVSLCSCHLCFSAAACTCRSTCRCRDLHMQTCVIPRPSLTIYTLFAILPVNFAHRPTPCTCAGSSGELRSSGCPHHSSGFKLASKPKTASGKKRLVDICGRQPEFH